MNTYDYIKLLDELDDNDALEAFFQFDAQRPRHPKGRISKKLEMEEQAFIKAQDASLASYSFTYHASRHEADWLLESLKLFHSQRWISDVLRLIKGGKEASVYLCKSGVAVNEPFLAVKVYRPRQFRNLKNDGLYRIGRSELDDTGHEIINDGKLHAIRKRTNYGEKLRHQSWIAYEYQSMQIFRSLNADVPAPYAIGNNAILMSYIGDQKLAAPMLQAVELERAEARRLFDRTLYNVDLMLSQGIIHADLSAYNILYWKGDITIIDFPQVVSPRSNPHAWQIFLRDISRVCDYFETQGVKTDPFEIAVELWRSHGYRVRKEVHPRHLDPGNVIDRGLWEEQNKSNR